MQGAPLEIYPPQNTQKWEVELKN